MTIRTGTALLATALIATALAGCQTQSAPASSSAGYGTVEDWPSYQSSRSNRGGD